LVQAFLKKWWVESDFKAPNLPLSLKPRVKSDTQEGNAFPVPLQSPIVVLLNDMTIKVILNIIQIVFAMKVHNALCTSGAVVLVWYLDLLSTYAISAYHR
jgi:hypothetical protein